MLTKASIKYLDNDRIVITGYGVVFGGNDVVNDRFTAHTDFGLEHAKSLPLYYDHGQHNKGGALNRKIGTVTEWKSDDFGLFVEAEIDRHHEYASEILQLVNQGVLGFSSGSVGHLVQRDEPDTKGVTEIKRWPIAELSLTPTPAEVRTIPVESKSADEDEPETTPEAETQGDVKPTPPAVPVTVAEMNKPKPEDEDEMADTNQIEALAKRMDGLSSQLEQALKAMQEVPAIRSSGGFTVDGGTADAEIKTLPDFLLAVIRKDYKRIEKVYGDKELKALSGDAGALGGVLIPMEFQRQILDVGFRIEPWLSAIRRIPVTSRQGKIPALDQSITPSADAGQTATAAGVVGRKRAEEGALQETQPQFYEVQWIINDAISGFVRVSNELLADSYTSVEEIITTTLARMNAQRTAYYVMRGNGVGEPLGIMNSPTYLTQTAATNNQFVAGDALNMQSRLFQFSGNPIWVAHRSNMTNIGQIFNGPFAYTRDSNVPVGTYPLYGYPVYFSETLPLVNNSGSVLLIDPGAYALFEYGGGLRIEMSEHAAFMNNQMTWRFTNRLDGQPLIKNVVRQGNPGASFAQSPFVGFTYAT